MRIKYTDYAPNAESREIIEEANEILETYEAQGFRLTLRQLYYQFIARDFFPNTERSYNRLGSIISRAREAGMVDWHHITDRGRQISERPHWDGPGHFLNDVADQFCLDLWEGQGTRCEVWVEKDALTEIAESAARPLDVPVLANKGYLSASAAWEAGHTRFHNSPCDNWVILHLGDHDPSGLDMTRDLQERIDLFTSLGCTIVQVERIALNMDQIEQYDPPPNPAKVTDSRFRAYQDEHGDSSWELDALEPSVLADLIRTEIMKIMEDVPLYESRKSEESEARAALRIVADEWDE